MSGALDDAIRRGRDYRRMRAAATGLLLAMAALFVVASVAIRAEPTWAPALGYVRAFAEAAVVGACADWFAVTALFRRPFGLPIPHTGVIPRNKDRIGDALGRFIADNFLTEEVLGARLKQLEVARWGGEWLREPANARRLAERLAGMAPGMLKSLPQDMLRDTVGSAAMAAARATPAAPTAAKLLSAAWSEGRAQALIDWGVDRLATWLTENSDTIQERVEARSYKWMPKFVDRFIAEKITVGVLQTLDEMRAPDHPWRQKFKTWVEELIVRLDTDPALIAQGEDLKGRLLADPRLHAQARALWSDIEARLMGGDTGMLADRLEGLLAALGQWLHAEQGAQARLNEWARVLALQGIAPRRHEIGGFVAQVVKGWDAASVVEKLELQVGRDLQYIRINGALVGGVVGLALYAASRWLGL